MIRNRISKCIFWLSKGFCSLLNQCKCVTINENSFTPKINENDYNPFREKL
jgi:hypothetical protein